MASILQCSYVNLYTLTPNTRLNLALSKLGVEDKRPQKMCRVRCWECRQKNRLWKSSWYIRFEKQVVWGAVQHDRWGPIDLFLGRGRFTDISFRCAFDKKSLLNSVYCLGNPKWNLLELVEGHGWFELQQQIDGITWNHDIVLLLSMKGVWENERMIDKVFSFMKIKNFAHVLECFGPTTTKTTWRPPRWRRRPRPQQQQQQQQQQQPQPAMFAQTMWKLFDDDFTINFPTGWATLVPFRSYFLGIRSSNTWVRCSRQKKEKWYRSFGK